MNKLIFFDIDGTIVTENGEERIIPQSAIDAIRQLQAAGNLCFVNSGRTMSEMDSSILNLGMDGFVCGCGTYISHHNEILFTETIPFELGNEILSDLEKFNLEWLLEGKDTLYYSTKKYTTHIGDFQEEHRKTFALSFGLIPPEKASNLVFDKFCLCTRPDSDFDSFTSKYSRKLEIIDRGNGFYEITPKNCSKASGMKFLMDYFNTPKEDTYAIGDSSNDLPMLNFAGTSIAMGNSSDVVLKTADYITDSVLNDGIYNAMKHFNLI